MKWQLLFGPMAFGYLTQAASMSQLVRKGLGANNGPSLQLCGEKECNQDLGSAPNWALKNVTRKLPRADEVWIGFHITSEGYAPQWCYVLVHVKGSVNSAGFSNVPCTGSDFSVSWGFGQENEAGIMTLVNRATSRRSWFGWNHVNDSEYLADVGPNATKDIEA